MSKREIIDVVFEEVFPKHVHNYKNETSIPVSSGELEKRVDDLRIADGKVPLFKEDDKGRQDFESWYEFRLIINRGTGEPQEVEAEVCGEQVSEEDAGVYHVKLTNEDKAAIKKELERVLERMDMTLLELSEWEDELLESE